MAKIHVIGRVTADLEVKTGTSGKPYVCFTITEFIGKERRTQTFHVWAWNYELKRLIDQCVGKGSLIWVTGSLELETFVRRKDFTPDKAMKIRLDDWGFTPVASPRNNRSTQAPIHDVPSAEMGCIDGDRDPLPE